MSSLRFFADHCVPTAVTRFLREQGYEVFQLRDHIPPDSPDDVVIATAQTYDAILLSLNGDFADIVSYPPEKYKGIIGIQVRNHPELLPRILKRLKTYLWEHPSMDDYDGRLLLIEVHRIRIRGKLHDQ
jgi:predicted nuclease of predicted toxin-antitoxin system